MKAVMRALFKVSPSLRKRAKAARRAVEQRTDRRLVDQWHNEIRPNIETTIASNHSMPVTLKSHLAIRARTIATMKVTTVRRLFFALSIFV